MADLEGVRATLEACLRYFRERGDEPCYGFFLGGDPRLFTPDGESNTPEEIESHRVACEAWERGERPELRPGCRLVGGDEAFGMGMTTMVDEEMRDLAEQCETAIAKLGDTDGLR